jgi:lipid-A-disaccharide synthase
VRELKKLSENIEFTAVGGGRLKACGVPLVADSSHWGAIGIWQSSLVGLKALTSFYRVKRFLSDGPPGLFIPIDFGFMNIRLSRHAKKTGWKVLYFVPPGSWRRDKQGADLAVLTDGISTPFAWSAEILKKMGANAHWFGHPIKQLLVEAPTAARGDSIAVLPGSRSHEIDNNLPVIAHAVEGPVEFALAPGVNLEQFKARWQALRMDSGSDVFTVGDTSGVLRRAKAAIVCSGTATLEAALCGTPMVVVYRASKAMVLEAKLIGFKMPKYISLPNIVLDQPLVPELIHDAASPESVRNALRPLLHDSEERFAQLAGFQELNLLLGDSQAITETAKLAMSILSS